MNEFAEVIVDVMRKLDGIQRLSCDKNRSHSEEWVDYRMLDVIEVDKGDCGNYG